MKYLSLICIASLLWIPAGTQAAATRDAPSAITTRCSVSQSDGATAVDWSFGASNPQSAPSGAGRRGYEYYRNMSDFQVTISPAVAGMAPTVTWHAINTKGAGSNDRLAAPALACDAAAQGQTAAAATTAHCIPEPQCRGDDVSARHAINTKGMGANDRLAADIQFVSCDAADDTLSLHLVVPASSKVVVRDISVMRIGGGGMPVVKGRDAVVVACTGPNGEATTLAMQLLLPAVQR